MTATTTLYLTRHGETVWNVEGRFQGRLDSPLTEHGVEQATRLRDALRPVPLDALYTSSSPRAWTTAEILSQGRHLPITALDDLREIALGEWEGQLTSELERRFPTQYAAFWQTPHLYTPANGGESFAALQRRVAAVLDRLLARHAGQTILAVTHAAALKALLAHIEPRPLEHLWEPPFIHPTALCKVVIADGRAAIKLCGDISHYHEAEGGA